MTITDTAHLLEFLDAKDIAQLLHARKDASQLHAAVWHWVTTRMRVHLPDVELPHWSPQESARDTAVLVALLRRLHAIMTFAFDVRFDATRLGSDVRIADDDRRLMNSGVTGGSIVGDCTCIPNAVSYFECEGLSDSSYIGVTTAAPPLARVGTTTSSFSSFSSTATNNTNNTNPLYSSRVRFGAPSQQQSTQLLSRPPPACDHMPAIMYCASGFVTTGAFRGPKPQLPAHATIVHAPPFVESDHVGVFVDLLTGKLVFTRNGCIVGPSIALDRTQVYRPIVSTRMCYHVRLVEHAQPPWQSVYDIAAILQQAIATTTTTKQ